jgi:predicted acetyltransferase
MNTIKDAVTIAAVTLEPVTSNNASTLNNLFELYTYDFTDQMPLRIQPNGRFELGPGEVWWTQANHFAYLIQLGDELAGFALVREGSRVTGASEGMDVSEFFVLRGLRGKGVGRSAADALFRTVPGAWEVRVRRTNSAALRFWTQVATNAASPQLLSGASLPVLSGARQPVLRASHPVPSGAGTPVPRRPFTVDGVDWDLLQFVAGGQ